MNADTKHNQNVMMLAETMYEISPWQSDRIFEIIKTCGNLKKSTGLKIIPAYGPLRKKSKADFIIFLLWSL